MLLSELPGMLRECLGQRGGLRPSCAQAGWREVGTGSPAGWLLLTFDGSWDPPPPVARYGAWHLLIVSSRTCADLINPIPVSAPPCTRIPAVGAGAISPASRQLSWLWLLTKPCQGGRGAAALPPLPGGSSAVHQGAKRFDVTCQDVVKHLAILG